MSNKAGWWWEARVVVGGWQPGREFGARRQVEVEAKDLQAAANELLCWSRSYKGEEKILDKQGQVYFSSQCNGLQFTMHRLFKSKTNSQPRWYFFCRAGESLREDAKMGQLTLRTGFIWSTSTGAAHNQLVCMKDAQQVAVPVAKADQADQHGDHHGRDHHGLRSPLWIQLKVLGRDREDGLGGAGGGSLWNL